MKTLMAVHEVENVDHWLKSPKRAELFGPAGIKVRTFVDASAPLRVGLIMELPDSISIDQLKQMLATPEAAAAMEFDGVRPETIRILVEA